MFRFRKFFSSVSKQNLLFAQLKPPFFVHIEQAHFSCISNTDIIAEAILFVDIYFYHKITGTVLVTLPISFFLFTFVSFYVLIVTKDKHTDDSFVSET